MLPAAIVFRSVGLVSILGEQSLQGFDIRLRSFRVVQRKAYLNIAIAPFFYGADRGSIGSGNLVLPRERPPRCSFLRERFSDCLYLQERQPFINDLLYEFARPALARNLKVQGEFVGDVYAKLLRIERYELLDRRRKVQNR